MFSIGENSRISCYRIEGNENDLKKNIYEHGILF